MALSFRYRLQAYGGSRRNRYACPGCGQAHQFTRWLDTQTGEQLPAEFGRCNRIDQCGYSRSPYEPGPGGQSYAAAQASAATADVTNRLRSRILPPAPPLCVIPEQVVQQSLRAYERNSFAHFLQTRFGAGIAADLLHRFEIGTSTHWPGATVFWQRDEWDRVRGGQVVLFDAQGHTVKQRRGDGTAYRCTTWVHTALAQRCQQQGIAQPTWLTRYLDPANQVAKSPSLYGLRQLATIPSDQPIGLVEAPKTAVVCTGYLPSVTWLAVGSLSQLTSVRLHPLKAYPLTLYPDASVTGHAYNHWMTKAAALRQQGFKLCVSSLLEQKTTSAQQLAGYDLADVLLDQWPGYPPSWDSLEVN